MKKWLFCFLFFTTFISSICCAQNYYSPNRLYVGSDLYYRELKQRYITASHSEEKGFLKGFAIGYDFTQPNSIYFGCDIYYNYAKAMEKSTWFQTDIKNDIANYEGRLGITVYLHRSLLLTPFVNYGYHRLKRIADPNPDIAYSSMTYRWNYFGGGGRLYLLLSPAWRTACFITVVKMINGKVKITPKSSNVFTVEYDQGSNPVTSVGDQWCYSIELPNYLYLPTLSPFDLTIIPYYNSFDMKRGKSVGSISNEKLEGPETTSYDFGLRIEMGLSF